MYQVKYKQIDPDTGRIIREEKMANCESLRMANWITTFLIEGESDPNREYFIVEPDKLSLDQLMREYQPFMHETPRDITIIDEKGNDLIVAFPSGDTMYMTKQEYEQIKKRSKND